MVNQIGNLTFAMNRTLRKIISNAIYALGEPVWPSRNAPVLHRVN